MDYKVTRNGQQTGHWFVTAADAWKWLDQQLAQERALGFPMTAKYIVYYNPTGTPVNALGVPVLSPTTIDVSTITEYGLAQKLSKAIRCF